MENRKTDPTPTDKEFELFQLTVAQRLIIITLIAVVAFLVYYGATVLFFGQDFWLDSIAPGLSTNQ